VVELLSKAIHEAHHNLVETSPETIELIPVKIMKSDIMCKSPSVTKVQRRKTTMEMHRSSTSSICDMRGSTFTYDRISNSAVEVDLGRERKRLKRRRTTADAESSVWELPDSPVSVGAQPLAVVTNQHIESDYSPETTFANTSTDTGMNCNDRPPAGRSVSLARMTTPTISSRSGDENAYPSIDRSSDVKDGDFCEEYEVDVNTQTSPICLHVSSQEASKVGTTAQVIINTKITQCPAGDKDELSLSCSSEDDIQARLSLKKLLRNKHAKDENVDELGLEDFSHDIPQEQYKPRPSRSRAITSQSLDDMVLAIDYSKRPEAVVRKAKRRKTTGTRIEEEERDIGVEHTNSLIKKMSSKSSSGVAAKVSEAKSEKTCEIWEVSSDENSLGASACKVANPKTEKKRGRKTKVVDSDDEEDCIRVATEEYSTTKKSSQVKSGASNKKARKRGKTEEDSEYEKESMVVREDELAGNPGSEPDTVPKQADNAPFPNYPIPESSMPAAAPAIPLPRTARKRKPLIEDITISEDPPAAKDQALPDTTNTNTRDETPPLTENDSAANIPKAQSQDKALSKSEERATTPAPIETPKKVATKGPTKHSPINSSKVKYRVGLSKKARIEPLLKFVRKDP
jgi:hypothetical protein